MSPEWAFSEQIRRSIGSFFLMKNYKQTNYKGGKSPGLVNFSTLRYFIFLGPKKCRMPDGLYMVEKLIEFRF